MTPRTSVVIASGAGGEFLFRAVGSLIDQAAERSAEIVVVDRVGSTTRDRLAREFPRVRVVAAPSVPRPTVPQMRRIGVEASAGAIVAILEEHCVAPRRWIETIETAFVEGDAAVGGPIDDASFERLADWAVYFSEYHNFMPPWPDGPRALLNGANIAYRRDALLAHRSVLDEGYWEVVLHPLLSRTGALRGVNAMAAQHTGPFGLPYYLRQRYLLSRVWGGTARDRVGIPVRVAHIVLAPIFPFLMLARIASRVVTSGRHTSRFLLATPMLFAAMCALTLGETLGYLMGPGTALLDVE